MDKNVTDENILAQIEARNQLDAQEKLKDISTARQQDMVAYSRLRYGVHVGINAFGERVTPAERVILQTTLASLRKRMMSERGVDTKEALEAELVRDSLGNTAIVQELSRRYPPSR